VLDSAFFYPAYWIGRVPVASHLNGHIGTFEKHEEKHFFMYEMGAIDIIREAYAAEGVYQSGFVSYGGFAVYSNRPLTTRKDFSGFRVRSTGAAASVFEKMGATPVSIPGGELYQALQTGVVEGAHWGCISTGRGMNFHEVCKFVQQPDLVSHLSGEVMVNLKKWNSIGRDLQATFNEIVRATSADASAHFLYHDYLGAKQYTEKEGGTITTLDADTIGALRSASLQVVDEFSARDPKYSGKVGALLHEFMRMTGKV
jgi:TRAP-type mannitol/chloroaromatic compound transport system substrate-binding protein